jgi:redox-sensitive bicupin YhaK (pirin superfamily)
MIKVYPYEELGHASHGWLDARHHFSFANYYNPERMGLGTLRVINDDVIKAGAGFDAHPHRNMEIITYVRSGAITHRDSQGNEGKTLAGDVQVMSAGTGVFHSEYNLENEDTNIYQIWIEPKVRGIKPDWDAHEFPKEPVDTSLKLLVSGDEEAPLHINQDAYIYAGILKADKELDHPIHQQAYLLVSEGEIELEGQHLKKGDGAEVDNTSSIKLYALKDSEVLVIDVPLNKKI